MTIFLDTYLCEIPCPAESALKHIIRNYIRWMVIWSGRQEYGYIFIIILLCYFKVLIVQSKSTMCSHATAMLTSTSQNLSVTFSISITIIMTCITKIIYTYNFITLFKFLMSCPGFWLGIFLMAKNLSFFIGWSLMHLHLPSVSKLCVTFRNLLGWSLFLLSPP